MSKLTWNPGTLLAPVPPAMVTCGTLERPNLLTIAWTGIASTHPAMTYISVRPTRHSYGLIKDSGEFVINLTTAALVRACDYCGVRSGAKEDKLAACGLTVEPASKVSAPLLAQSPLSLECRVKQVLALGSHDMFLAEIVAMDVDPALVDAAGKLHLERAGLAAYAHGTYYELGRRLGTFGYSVARRPAGRGAKRAAKRPSGGTRRKP